MRPTSLLRFFFAFVDLLALNIVHAAVLFALSNIPVAAEKQYLYLFVAANMFWLISAFTTALYIDNVYVSWDVFAKRTIKAFVVFNILMLFFMFAYNFPFSRLFMGISFLGFLIFLISTRLALVGVSFYMKRSNYSNRKIVIVGYNEIAKTLVERFSVQRKNFQIAGFFENPTQIKELSTLPIIGSIDDCLDYALKNEIQEIYSTIPPERHPSLYEMAQVAEQSLIRFKFVPDFRLYINRATHMEYLADIPILSLRPEPLEDAGNALKKRIFDVIFSALVIVFILTWLMPILAILIKLTSPGPVFFSQVRSGKNNKKFHCLKFRTLKMNKEADSIQVTKNDSRVTPIGKFLRKSNLDELPQFLNVLLGDMSVVGPRPHMLKHTSSFSSIIEEYMIRHFVKPGVTGWAQVNGHRGEIKKNEQLRKRIEFDIWYMENWSLWLDVKVIFLTVYTTFRGDKNAY